MEGVNFGEWLGTAFVIIMFLAGVVTTIGAATAVIKRWWSASKLKKNGDVISRHEEELKNHNFRLKQLENRTDEQDNFIAVICNSMLALLDQNINGDSLDKLKHARDEMENFLIKQKINKKEGERKWI